MTPSRAARYPMGARIRLADLERDPHPHLAQLRRYEPVSWLPALDGWLVASRALAIEVMRDAETYTVDDPRFSTARVIGPSMLSLDGGQHQRHREPFVDPFRAAPVRERLEQWTIDRARYLVRGFAGDGFAELRSQLAAPLAVDVTTEALGLDGVDSADLLDWYDEIVAAVDEVTAGRSVPDTAVRAFAELTAAVQTTMRSRPNSLAARVIRMGDLTSDEIVSNVAVLLFGGIVTSEATTATLLHQVLLHPEQLEAARRDRAMVPGAVEEALRYEPAASVVDRYATRDAVLGSAEITRGDLVRISLAAAGRDEAVFDDPDRFDVRRNNANQHLAFARGPHACLGIHLARLESRVALEVLLDELPALTIDPGTTRPPHGLIFRAPAAVGARW